MELKKLRSFLKVFIFVQLGGLLGKSLQIYFRYKKNSDLYEILPAPWYSEIITISIFTAITVALTLIAYLWVNHKIKTAKNKDEQE